MNQYIIHFVFFKTCSISVDLITLTDISDYIKWLPLYPPHRYTQGGEGGGGIKVYPPSKIFATPRYIPSLPKFGKNLMDPLPGFLNCVHQCPSF